MLTAQEIERMSHSEKLQLMKDLWNNLMGDEISSSAWHLGILENREQRILSGEAKFTDWESAKEAIRRRVS